MVLIFNNVPRSVKYILKRAGYTHRPAHNDWVREDQLGRWHAKIPVSKDRLAELHYDLFIENRHVVFDMPYHAGQERRRILSYVYPLRTYEYKEGQFQKILDRNGYGKML